ncbi:MAG: alternative ribosome rescue aminoacyl-tRNA hydrolase ArfB [Planctomycetota bacterium]
MPLPVPENPHHGVPLGPGIYVPESSIRVVFVRASGPGGQNVNRRATKAQLRVHLDDIPLAPGAGARLRRMARGLINAEGELLIQDDSTRSQGRNRDACIDRLRELVMRAMVPPKVRRKTRPTKGSIQRRLDEKKRRSETKRRRGGIDD